jgi:hypothetical protein
MILKRDFEFQTVKLYYLVSSEKILKRDFEFQTVILYFQVSSEKYDIKAGF